MFMMSKAVLQYSKLRILKILVLRGVMFLSTNFLKNFGLTMLCAINDIKAELVMCLMWIKPAGIAGLHF